MLPIWWVLNKVIDKNEGLVFDQIHKRLGHMEFCYQKPPGERVKNPQVHSREGGRQESWALVTGMLSIYGRPGSCNLDAGSEFLYELKQNKNVFKFRGGMDLLFSVFFLFFFLPPRPPLLPSLSVSVGLAMPVIALVRCHAMHCLLLLLLTSKPPGLTLDSSPSKSKMALCCSCNNVGQK